jgi:hypothetical protein
MAVFLQAVISLAVGGGGMRGRCGIIGVTLLLAAFGGSLVGGYRWGYLSGWAAGYGEMSHTFEAVYREAYTSGLKDAADINGASEVAPVEESPSPMSHADTGFRITP